MTDSSTAQVDSSASTTVIDVLGISGSLRKGSLNTALLRAAIDAAPDGTRIVEYTGLRDLPPYDADHDGDEVPSTVRDLRDAIGAADALLISTPEYNYSIPGVLKNAIDWASRPVPTSVLRRRPIAIMGAAPGNFGTVRAQLALRQMLVWTDSVPVVKPEVHVFGAANRFDHDGQLIDPETRELLVQLIGALRATTLALETP